MKGRFTHALPIVLMLFLAALTLWLQYEVQMAGRGDPSAKRHDPDAVIDNFAVRRLGVQGKPLYSLAATKMLHFPDDNATEILYPRFVYLNDTDGNMTVTASRGVLTKDGDEVFLYGNVLLVQDANTERGEIHAQTEYLHLLSETRMAETDHPVILTEERSVLTGVGMRVRKDAQEFSLLSEVKGKIDAPRRK